MVKKLMTRTQFAREAGVSPAAVTKACSGALKEATEGKRVNAAHPVAVAYLETKTRDNAPPAAAGLDAIYEQAVAWCQGTGRYSITGIQQEFKIGYNRAARIVGTMRASGLIPEGKDPTAEGYTTKCKPPLPPEPKEPHVRGTAAAREKRKLATPPPADHVYEVPEHIEDFADMTVRELTYRFGTDVRFLDWLKATKAIEDIHEKRLKNAQTKGTLISRGLVQVGVIDVFNSAHLKLMKDGAKSIAAGTVSKHAAGADLVEIETYISDILGSFIRPVKNKIKRALDNANP